jgi:hypothetical protein
MGGIDDSDALPGQSADGTDQDRRQRPLARNKADYYEPGRLNVAEGPYGQLPVVIGDPPDGPEPGLTDDNLICCEGPGRAECVHFAQVLLPAPGVARGHAPMKEIRSFCLRLATASELHEIDGEVFACTLRSPPDPKSTEAIRAFRRRQKEIAQETSETSGELDF